MQTVLLKSLYCGVHDGWLNLWTKQGNLSKWFPFKSPRWLDDAMACAEEMDANGCDVFYAVCPSKVKKGVRQRASKPDAACLPAYFVDVDTLLDPRKKGKRLAANPAEALTVLNDLSCPPSLCVISGHGLHPYWLLTAPKSIDDPEATTADLNQFAKAIVAATGWELDAGASEPARVLRVPGTHNHKENPPLPVKLIQPEGEPRRYTVEELNAFALTYRQPAEAPAPAPTFVDDVNRVDYQTGGKYYLDDEAIWQMLSRRDERIPRLKAGDISGYGSQSEADLAMCDALAFATGRDPVRVDELFRQTALYRGKWDEKHGRETYGERTIMNACRSCKAVYRGRDYLLDRLNNEARAGFEALQAAYASATGGAYIAQPFRTCACKKDGKGNVTVETLADFVIHPIETIRRDDGAEQTLEYVFEGVDVNGRELPRVTVPASRFKSFQWVMENWPGAVIEPGTAKPDKLRAAVQKVERVTAIRRTVYAHSGWRCINGKWAFLYNGGAVGVNGVSVELAGNLAGYTIPEAKPEDSSTGAAMASLALLDIAPDRVTVPLLATMYLAPLCEWFDQAGEPVNHILILQGKTQSKKSVLSSLFLNHFGTRWNFQNMPFNFQSTANATREGIFLAKDLPAIVDDFHPTPTGRGAVERMNQIAQDLARAWGDHAARQRMNADGSLRTAKPARGLGIFTAEYPPDLGESGLSRAYIAPMTRHDVDNAKLSKAQEAARLGVYARSMRGYLEWLCWRVNEDAAGFAEALGRRFREKRLELLRADYDGHDRLATAGAHMLIGFEMALEYFQTVGAIDPQGAAETLKRATAAILAGLAEHAEGVKASDPVRIFAETMLELAETAHRFVMLGTGSQLIDDSLGFMDNDWIYAKPKGVFAAVRELCMKSGSPFPLNSQPEMLKRLYEAGISSTEKAKTQRLPDTSVPMHCIRINRAKLAEVLANDKATPPTR